MSAPRSIRLSDGRTVSLDEARAICEQADREARERLVARYGKLAIEDLAMAARLSVVEHLRACRRNGVTLKSVAERLGISGRTLRSWDERERKGRLSAAQPGRPRKELHAKDRAAILRVIRRSHATIGVGRLKQQFPDVARSALRELILGEREKLAREALPRRGRR